MNANPHAGPKLSRRGFFDRVADGMQGAALTYLLSKELFGVSQLGASEAPAPAGRRAFDLRPQPTRSPPKAKAVIQLFMNGGPSQVDLFDPKPMLDRHHGRSVYNEIAADVS